MGKKTSNQGHWSGLKADPYHYFGFVYVIEDKTSGKKYIGKKQYWMSRGKVKGCRNRVTDRQSDKFKMRCWHEGDWRVYKGSSNDLKKHMKMFPDNKYTYTILCQCRSKGTLHYRELKELWDKDVLFTKHPKDDSSYLYFNKAIGAIKFRPPTFVSEETRLKCSKNCKGSGNPNVNLDILKFFNMKTREEFTGTRLEFTKFTGFKHQSVLSFCNEDSAGLYDWRLYEHKDKSTTYTRMSPTVETRKKMSKAHLANKYVGKKEAVDLTEYTFEHSELGVYTGTKYDMCKEYPILRTECLKRVIDGKQKHHQNWRLISDD